MTSLEELAWGLAVANATVSAEDAIEAGEFTSRVSGNPAPFMTTDGNPQWESGYYPPASVQNAMGAAVSAEIRALNISQPAAVG